MLDVEQCGVCSARASLSHGFLCEPMVYPSVFLAKLSNYSRVLTVMVDRAETEHIAFTVALRCRSPPRPGGAVPLAATAAEVPEMGGGVGSGGERGGRDEWRSGHEGWMRAEWYIVLVN